MVSKIICLIYLLSLTSCVSYYYTEQGGIRVKNPKVFKYNKKKYTELAKTLIDTNVIYLSDSIYNKKHEPKWQKSDIAFIRFFNTGQILFVGCQSVPSISEINNPNLGVPGYFILQGTRLKIDMFQDLNGGQTGKYFGRIQPNGDLVLYEGRPETFYSSFWINEKLCQKSKYSTWKKAKIDNIEHYRPNW